MVQRPIWKGHLRLALVSCPVALYSARHDREAIRFNMINPATGNRIKMVSQDAQTGEDVARRDTIKGYEVAKGQYVIITDEDLESVRVESSEIMKVEKFVDAGSIDPIYYDASYYLAPDSRVPRTSTRFCAKRSRAPARWRSPASSSPSASARSRCGRWMAASSLTR